MFPSYAVVPVFVFAILLNFCLYSPIYSQQAGAPPMPPPPPPPPAPENFTKCEDCVKSPCFTASNGTCGLSSDNTTYTCYACPKDPAVNVTFACQTECQKSCTDQAKECVCDGMCYSCVLSASVNKSSLTCTAPQYVVDATCKVTPVGPQAAGANNATAA